MPYARRNLILACLFFLLIPVPALRAQQGGVGSVIGELHLSRGDFPGRIFVELQLHSATIASVYSDDQGKFGFYALESNPYHVVIHDERFYPVDQLVALDTSISQMSMAQITLTPRERVEKEPLPNREPGSNPYLIDLAEYRRHFPKNAVKEFAKGVEADKNQKRDEAIRHYEKALSLAPDFYPAHNNLGSDYLSKSDFKSAEAQFRETIRLDPNEAQAYFNLSNVLMHTDRLPEAETTLAAGLQRRPDSAFGYFLQGCLYGRTGKLAQAESSLQNALRLDPKMSDAYLQLVAVYLRQNRIEDAIKQLQAFLKGFPTAAAAPRAQELLTKLQKEESAVKR